MTPEATAVRDAGREELLGALIIVAGASLFGTLGVLSRSAYAAGMIPFAFVTWRAGVGGFGIWAAVLGRRGARSLVRELLGTSGQARRGIAVATLAATTLNLCMFAAFDRTTVALALLAFYTYPAMVAAASVALGREQLTPARSLALVLALAGMVAVVGGGSGVAAQVDALGIALALVAAACQATFVLTSRGYASVPADQAIAAVLLGSAVVSAAITLLVAGPATLAFPFQRPELLGLLLVVGLLAAALPSILFLTGIRRIGGVRAGILMLFEPLVGVALAAAFLDEGISAVQALGGATVLVAAFLVQRSPTPADEPLPIVAAPGGP